MGSRVRSSSSDQKPISCNNQSKTIFNFALTIFRLICFFLSYFFMLLAALLAFVVVALVVVSRVHFNCVK